MSTPKNYFRQGDQALVVGGEQQVKSGGSIDVETGGALKVAGTDRTAALATAPAAVAAGYKIARGQHTTVDEDDTVVTGLATVVSAVAVLESDPTDTASVATCVIGNQAGAPAAGSIQIKTWKPTVGGAAGNPTLIAASAFSKKVNWIAVGT